MAKDKAKAKADRKVLVILSNRFNRAQKPKYLELLCRADGSIVDQRPLRSEPKEARFAEVWINDEGRTSLDSCTRMKRIYRHALEQKAEATT